MKKIFHALSVCAAAGAWMLLGSSCVSPTEVVYLQDVQPGITEKMNQNYQATIQKDDQLSITVSSKQPELTAPFAVSEMGQGGAGSASSGMAYLVDAKGDIVLPIIGKVHAAGKTCTQLAGDIAAALQQDDYIRDASVNVQIKNFKFSVLGEVGSPGVHTIEGQRLTILEAISLAGDLNIQGNRDVLLIREKDGKREIAKIDLRSKDLFSSPYYYVQQNDVIYVTPTSSKINTRSDVVQWMGWSASGIGIILSIIALASL